MGRRGLVCPSQLVVIGGGFVGLHAAVHAALKGVRQVYVVDVNPEVVERINSGDPRELHVREPYVVENWPKVRSRITATLDYRVASEARHIIVAVQTPRRGTSIDFTPLHRVAENLAPNLQPYTLISSEVTIYPGGTWEHLGKIIHELTGYEPDEELLLAHVPERLVAGSRKWNPENIPRVVGAIGLKSLQEAVNLYSKCLGVKVYPVKDIRIAEAAKILENGFRLLNIAFVNELKRYLDAIGVDVRAVIEAAATKPFGYMPFHPGPYAGGACLPKDSLMLELASGSLLLRIAREINETQPAYYARKLLPLVRRYSAKRILFLGLGFKPDIPYPIESPPLKVAQELAKLDPTLDIRKYDPQIPEASDFKSSEEALSWADLIVRWGYKNINPSKPVIDLENI